MKITRNEIVGAYVWWLYNTRRKNWTRHIYNKYHRLIAGNYAQKIIKRVGDIELAYQRTISRDDYRMWVANYTHPWAYVGYTGSAPYHMARVYKAIMAGEMTMYKDICLQVAPKTWARAIAQGIYPAHMAS